MTGSLSRGKPMEVGGYGIGNDELPALSTGPVDLRGWFGQERPARPLELEIGSGKGTFGVAYASQRPEVNLVGLEWAKAYWRYAADRARRHGLDNVRMVRADAAMFVRQYVPDQCIRQVHVYHPDPWPKKRHHKRRLIQQTLLHQLYRVLLPASEADPEAGLVRITTDHAGYFAWIEEAATETGGWFEKLTFEPPLPTAEGELVGTNFERKYREEGRSFYGLMLRKR
jgi:tRNA (guanine-N7-)-methyltransferase